MSERNNKLELLGSAPIPKALMALGVPIMIGMLINALYIWWMPILWADWAEVKWELFPSFFRWDKSWLAWALCLVTELHPICQDFWDVAIRILPIKWQVQPCIAAF